MKKIFTFYIMTFLAGSLYAVHIQQNAIQQDFSILRTTDNVTFYPDMDKTELEAIRGTKGSIKTFTGIDNQPPEYLFQFSGLDFYTGDPCNGNRIEVTGKNYITPRGIRIGDTKEMVFRKYGRSVLEFYTEDQMVNYKISFLIGNKGRVVKIVIVYDLFCVISFGGFYKVHMANCHNKFFSKFF